MHRDVLPPVHNIVARNEHCVQRTLPVRTVFFVYIIIRWTRGGGGTPLPLGHKLLHHYPWVTNSYTTTPGSQTLTPLPLGHKLLHHWLCMRKGHSCCMEPHPADPHHMQKSSRARLSGPATVPFVLPDPFCVCVRGITVHVHGALLFMFTGSAALTAPSRFF